MARAGRQPVSDDPRAHSPVNQMSRTEAVRGHGVASKVSGAAWRQRQAWLTLGALGVVYGDIGTSPLYAVRQSVLATGAGTATHDAVLGAISLILWSLTIIVTIKYIVFILRADNKGEGGVIALASLAHRCPGLSRRMKTTIGAAGVLGLALFFGDGMLTPAISVLSAVEGIKLEEPELAPLVLPLTLIILLGLFLIQNRGTGRLGRLFGPIVLLWFLALAALGVRSIAITPAILLAVNPWEGISLFIVEPWVAFVALGSVVLTVTGVETLYADMGHFGRTAIRLGWLVVTFPALVLNYLGQGALATAATATASQAVFSGVFSITRQSVQLGQLPRMEIRHTSATDYGQIYVPRANTLMLIGVITIVLIYKNSDALAAAYGMAVTGMMSITTFLGLIVAT